MIGFCTVVTRWYRGTREQYPGLGTMKSTLFIYVGLKPEGRSSLDEAHEACCEYLFLSAPVEWTVALPLETFSNG